MLVAARFEVAQHGRDDERGLQSLAEQDGESRDGGDERRCQTGLRQRALHPVETVKNLGRDRAHFARRRALLHGAAEPGEVFLELERQCVVAYAKRNLDELEVIEVCVPRRRIGLLRLAGLVQVGALGNECPSLVEVDERLLGR